MALPEWRQKLEDALKNNKEKMPFAKYYQVATIRNDLRPANRTVVHRGFYGDNAITWCTDKRTSKMMEVRENPWGEAAWYLEDSREQFRLNGKLTIVGSEHTDETLLQERKRMWSGLSPGARQQFTYPDPGRDRETSSEDDFKKESPPEDSEPLDHFCLVVHDIDEVDYLSLLDNRRIEYRSPAGPDGQRQWSSREVNP